VEDRPFLWYKQSAEIKPTTTTAAGYIVSSFTPAATKHEYHTERVSRDWLINQRPIEEHLIALSVECVAITAILSGTYLFTNVYVKSKKLSFTTQQNEFKKVVAIY